MNSDNKMNWYYKLLANRPYFVLVAVAVFSIACIVVALTFQKFPDFSDPTLGFEARGTIIGQRLTAWRNLLEETKPSGMLLANPNEVKVFDNFIKDRKGFRLNKSAKQNKKIKFRKKLKFIKDSVTPNNKTIATFHQNYLDNDSSEHNTSSQNRPEPHWNYGRNLSYRNEEEYMEKIQMNTNQWKLLRERNPPASIIDLPIKTEGFFCESPNPEYSHFVVQRTNHNLTDSLFEINALLAMCDLEYQLEQIQCYDDLCERGVTTEKCCRPWSLPNYIALLSNKSSCFDIENEDVQMVKQLLENCFEYYHSLKLSDDCINSKCRVPTECEQYNAVYNIFHYLVDVEFINVNTTNVHLSAGMIFAPIAKSTKALQLFYNMEKRSLSNDIVSIVAMDMGLKNALFDSYLIADGWLICLGCLFVMTCMWIYTKSLFTTLMSLLAILFSLGTAYFIYTLILELPFFPFMNLLAIILLVGIGADDTFIFVKIWNCSIAERVKSLGLPIKASSITSTTAGYPETLAGLIAVTLKHAALSMLVTTLTTALALYASIINSITAVKCFGIFAGTAVISNYFLMITWLPASVSLVERISCTTPSFCKQTTNSFFTSINRASSSVEDFIISIILNVPKLWILVLGITGILSGLLVFYWPKLRLPDSSDFKMFSNDHPFEVYDSQFKNQFWFEKIYTDSETFKLPIRFVWGVKPIDNGNYLDPTSKGDLFLDNNFNISSTESQLWLLNFCKEFKRQPYYQYQFGPPMLPNCFIENFIRTMERRCLDDMSGIDRSPCCETSQFPYPVDVFNECLPQIISILYESPRYIFIPGIAGPKFIHETGNGTNSSYPVVKALVVEYESTQQYTMSYNEIATFHQNVEKWFNEMLKSAPIGMQNAWFISEFEFFDLQDTLSRDTIYAIGLSMGVSLLVLLMVTLNLLISLYAILTVSFTVLTTVATLILLDWKLNILESVSISTTIGLAVDFSLHYGLHYRMCPDVEREPCTRYALTRMIGPTAMAALTTGAAGAFMLPSNVLAYIQIGKFLVIVMSISWIYATFFLMSLLRVFGPQYGFGQFSVPLFQRKRENKNGKNYSDYNNSYRSSTHGTVSEQLLSASSSVVGEMIGSESHELSSLTSNSIVKPATPMESRPISFDRAFRKRSMIPSVSGKENSPTSISAITEVLPDDGEIVNNN